MKNSLLIGLVLLCTSSIALAQARNDNNQRNDKTENNYETIIENNLSLKERKSQRFGETEGAARGRFVYQNQQGNSEMFIRIVTNNQLYSVSIDDQEISNRNGYFRFFDLQRKSRMPITIRRNKQIIFQGYMTIRNQTRYVLDFDGQSRNLFLLNSTIINRNNSYYDWDNVWNSYYGSNNHGGGYNYGPQMMSNSAFNSFIGALKKESFGKNKLELLRTQATLNSFSSQQVANIISQISFEKDRLEAAKILYNSCIDQENYFLVVSSFTFDSYKRDLQKFIQDQNKRR